MDGLMLGWFATSSNVFLCLWVSFKHPNFFLVFPFFPPFFPFFLFVFAITIASDMETDGGGWTLIGKTDGLGGPEHETGGV